MNAKHKAKSKKNTSSHADRSIEEMLIDEAGEEMFAGDPNIKTLSEEIESLKEQLADSQDKVLRAHAETDNVRRRARQDVEKAHKYGAEKLIKNLLPIIDSLEKALHMAEKNHTVDGVSLTLKMLLDTLEKSGVTQVDPLHEPFNPHEHEAVSTVPNPEVEPNTVLEVLQKGYLLNQRLVRPAMVIVSK